MNNKNNICICGKQYSLSCKYNLCRSCCTDTTCKNHATFYKIKGSLPEEEYKKRYIEVQKLKKENKNFK